MMERDHNEISPSQLSMIRTSPPVPPPNPLEAEVEDTFHPPSSHPFPVRTRSNSSPTARPSSLSRLLAQASPLHEAPPRTTLFLPDDTIHSAPLPESSSSSPVPEPNMAMDSQAADTTISLPPASPSQFTDSLPRHLVTGQPSPLRPGSRASRLSTTSRFSVGRKPTLGVVASGPSSKAAPTVALADQRIPGSPSNDPNPFGSPITPSPDDSISEAMANVLDSNNDRRRTVSYHVSRASPLTATSSQSTAYQQPIRPPIVAATATSTLANLASSWGVTFGRRRRNEPSNIPAPATDPADASADTTGSEPSVNTTSANQHTMAEPSARALLGRF